MLGNIKAFIMSICLAVVFTILLVSANTMAMSIRERTREVAVLKTLGFTRNSILGLFVGEAVSLSLIGGLIGSMLCFFVVSAMASQGGMFTGMKVTPLTIAGGAADRRSGGIRQFFYSVLSRGQGQYRGRLAAYWVSGLELTTKDTKVHEGNEGQIEGK